VTIGMKIILEIHSWRSLFYRKTN